MPSVVAEGRLVVNNIERTASLFLVKNIFSLFLSIFSIILMVNYPLEPSQISLISMFTIGIPAFVMSLERNTDQIKGHFLSNVLFKALPGGLDVYKRQSEHRYDHHKYPDRAGRIRHRTDLYLYRCSDAFVCQEKA